MENNLTIENVSSPKDLFVAASASATEKFPIVIVFQEAFGVNQHIKNICRRLAERVNLAVAPDAVKCPLLLFYGG